jgi:hypothetical protein
MSRAAVATLAVVLLTAAHAVAIGTYFPDADGLRLSHDAFWWIASLAGVAGTLAGVRAFARGDHLRRVWSLLAATAALLLLGTALSSVWTHVAPGVDLARSPLIVPRFLGIVGANVCLTWALILLATTLRQAGLRPEPSLGAVAVWIAVLVLAILLGARQLVLGAGRLCDTAGVSATLAVLANMVSTAGDTVMLVLLVPILRTAFLLRGGRLAGAWWAMGVSSAAWLLFDTRGLLAPAFPSSDLALELLRVLRTPGIALFGLGGFLQREALRAPPEPQAPAAARTSDT